MGTDSAEMFESMYPPYHVVEYVDEMKKGINEVYAPHGKLLTYHKETTRSDLPEEVRKKINTDFYQGWNVEAIRKQSRMEQQNDIYKVYYTKGKEEHIVCYDHHGYISRVRKRKI